uniref:Uncharacterized protein n=1 Tax=Panagrolaimus sp. ES5 TaxID=591445 RepID=A0AC34FC30_9BILA
MPDSKRKRRSSGAGDAGEDTKTAVVERRARNRTPVKKFDPSEYYSPNYMSFLENRKSDSSRKFLQRKKELRNSLKNVESDSGKNGGKPSSSTPAKASPSRNQNAGLLKLQRKPMNQKSKSAVSKTSVSAVPAPSVASAPVTPTKSILKKSNFFQTPEKHETDESRSSESYSEDGATDNDDGIQNSIQQQDSEDDSTENSSQENLPSNSSNFTQTNLNEKKTSEDLKEKQVDPNLHVKVEKKVLSEGKNNEGKISLTFAIKSEYFIDAISGLQKMPSTSKSKLPSIAPAPASDVSSSAPVTPTKPSLKKSNVFQPPVKDEIVSDSDSNVQEDAIQKPESDNPSNANASVGDEDTASGNLTQKNLPDSSLNFTQTNFVEKKTSEDLTEKRVICKNPNLFVKAEKKVFSLGKNNNGLQKMQLTPKSKLPASDVSSSAPVTPTKPILKKSNFFQTPVKHESVFDSDSNVENGATQKSQSDDPSNENVSVGVEGEEDTVSGNLTQKRVLIKAPNLKVKVDKRVFPADKDDFKNVDDEDAPNLKVKVDKRVFPADKDDCKNVDDEDAAAAPSVLENNPTLRSFDVNQSLINTTPSFENDGTLQNLELNQSVSGTVLEDPDNNITEKRVDIKMPEQTVKVFKRETPKQVIKKVKINMNFHIKKTPSKYQSESETESESESESGSESESEGVDKENSESRSSKSKKLKDVPSKYETETEADSEGEITKSPSKRMKKMKKKNNNVTKSTINVDSKESPESSKEKKSGSKKHSFKKDQAKVKKLSAKLEKILFRNNKPVTIQVVKKDDKMTKFGISLRDRKEKDKIDAAIAEAKKNAAKNAAASNYSSNKYTGDASDYPTDKSEYEEDSSDSDSSSDNDSDSSSDNDSDSSTSNDSDSAEDASDCSSSSDECNDNNDASDNNSTEDASEYS